MSPPATHRRRLLRAAAAALGGVAATGCLARDDPDAATPDADGTPSPSPTRDPTATPTPRPTADDPTPDPADPIAVVVHNETDERFTATVTVGDDGGVVTSATVTVAPEGHRTVPSGVADTGEYRVSVAVTDGPEASTPLVVEGYDVRMGSNVIAVVDADGIRFLIEE
jgi:hypothetical protein